VRSPATGCRGRLAAFEEVSHHSGRLSEISLGGEADTLACIAGGIAQAYYGGVPAEIRDRAVQELDEPLRAILDEFEARFPP
jgi:ADP-ribosylglycohydrolase